MRKNVLVILFCLGAMFTNSQSNAQGTLIHYWHFNNYSQGAMHTPTINAIDADYSIHDTSKAQILYAEIPGTSVAYSSFIDTFQPADMLDYDTVNSRMGQPAGNAIRARNPSDSMQLLFYIPVVNYTNIVLKYGVERTNNGAQLQSFDYSLDSGATYITTGLSATSYSIATAHLFSLVSVNFPGTVANTPRLVFRVKFSTGSTDTSGNNRFDNVTVEGDSIIGTTSVAMNEQPFTPTYTLYPNPVTNSLEINTGSEGDKSFTITNEIGQSVYAAIGTGRTFSINTTGLVTGYYYITVRDSNTGALSTMKFIKE